MLTLPDGTRQVSTHDEARSILIREHAIAQVDFLGYRAYYRNEYHTWQRALVLFPNRSLGRKDYLVRSWQETEQAPYDQHPEACMPVN